MQEWRFLGVTFICKSSKILLHSRFSEKIVTLKVCKLMKSMKIIWCHKINWIIWDFICTLNNRFIPNLVYTQMGVIERCSEVPQASNFIKNRLWHRCFPVNFVKFIRAPFLQNTSGRLLLANITFINYRHWRFDEILCKSFLFNFTAMLPSNTSKIIKTESWFTIWQFPYRPHI